MEFSKRGLHLPELSHFVWWDIWLLDGVEKTSTGKHLNWYLVYFHISSCQTKIQSVKISFSKTSRKSERVKLASTFWWGCLCYGHINDNFFFQIEMNNHLLCLSWMSWSNPSTSYINWKKIFTICSNYKMQFLCSDRMQL